MATAEGYLRRLTRRLTEDPEQRDVEELSDEAANTGAQKAIDCQRGQEVTMVGTLRSVECNGKGCAGGVKAELFDGTDSVTLVWLGQRRIPGIESGRRCRCTAASASWTTAPKRSTTRSTRFRSEDPDTDNPPPRCHRGAAREGAQAVLEQMGGISGLIYSSLPIVVFVPVSTAFGLMPAIGAALGVATLILAGG